MDGEFEFSFHSMKVPLLKLIKYFFVFSIAISGGCSGSDKIVGLKNFGETCYANSIFQLLYHNIDFRHSLKHYLREKGPQADENLSALQKIFDKMDDSRDGASITPNTFEALPKTFERSQQYDVAEVLAYYQSIPGLDWSDFAIQMRGLFDLSNTATIEIDLELFLNVEERGKNSLSLSDLLDDHFAKKRIEISPSNLIVRIKRLHEVDGIPEKNSISIRVRESLSLRPYFIEGIESDHLKADYQLESFIEHVGNSPNGGHYKFYFKRHATLEYYMISDEQIARISQKEFLQKAASAYMYLYRNIQN